MNADIVINHQPGIASYDQTTRLKTSVAGLEGTATISMSESVDSLESIKSNEDEPKNGHQKSQRPIAQVLDNDSSSTQNGSSIMKNLAGSTAGNSANRKVFVLSGRRRKKSKTYLIGNNAFDISRDRCLAKLKSNVLGTQFTAIR